MLGKGKKILKNQPFSELLGAELTVFEKGSAELSLAIKGEFQQNYGYVHGGVLSYLVDNSITFAAASVLGDCVTSEYKINYLQPAKGQKLVAKAFVLSSGKRQAICECRVFSQEDENENIVAAALGTIVKVKKQKMP